MGSLLGLAAQIGSQVALMADDYICIDYDGSGGSADGDGCGEVY